MNARERFLACMRFEPVDRAPDWEMGYWAGTLDRWLGEGLAPLSLQPTGLVAGIGVKGQGFPWRRSEPRDYAVEAQLGLDRGLEKIDGEWGVWPPFAREVLWEDERSRLARTLSTPNWRASRPSFAAAGMCRRSITMCHRTYPGTSSATIANG